MTGSVSDTSYDMLMNSVRARLPGALDEMIEQELGALLQEFFDRTNAWYEGIAFTTVLDDRTYTLTPSAGEIIRLIQVLDANDLPVNARLNATTSMTNELELDLGPSDGNAWTAYVSLRPTAAAPLTSAPMWIWPRYRIAFEHGICGRMMSQPVKPYSNVTLATYHSRCWRNELAKAVADVFRSFTFRGQNWNYPQAFRTPRRR